MKRFHVHVSVEDIGVGIRFYSEMFGTAPTVCKPDYAKWMLDDPRVNFAISNRAHTVGVNHLGIQAESNEELAHAHQQMEAAGAVTEQPGTSCCYTRSDKYWITDPAGIAWEAFHSLGDVPTYNGGLSGHHADACCVPVAPVRSTDGASTTNNPCCVKP
jgi:hypothetical protein